MQGHRDIFEFRQIMVKNESSSMYTCQAWSVLQTLIAYLIIQCRPVIYNTTNLYNIASRDAQSNSVYVSVLKIPIVHADSVSKSLRQNFFFFSGERPLLARGKKLFFAIVMDANRDSAHKSQNEDSFATFSLGLEFLNEAEKEENNGNFA